MELVYIVRWLHLIGAAVLLGTGLGIAFFMVMAHRTRSSHFVSHVASTVVIADWIFTATAVVTQPITGSALACLTGWRLTEGWILASLALYIFTGAFWIPVVFIQKKMRDLARAASAKDEALPSTYFKLYRLWFACGFPAFFAVLLIIWLMIARPTIG